MHELAICQALIGQLEQIARAEGARGVTRAVVRAGALSGVEPDLLERAFGVAQAGSIAAGATLCIESVPVTVRCTSCSAEGAAAPNRLVCPACGDWRVRVTGGADLLLAQVELEYSAATAAGEMI